MIGYEGEIDSPKGNMVKNLLYWEYITISRGGFSIIEQLEADPHISNPSDYIFFFSLRTRKLLFKFL